MASEAIVAASPLRSNRLLNCVRDPVRLLVDLVEFPAFNQQANFWLGSGVAQKHTAFSGKFLLCFAYQFHHRRQVGERGFFFHDQAALGLWVFFQTHL